MFKVRYSYLPQQFGDPSEILEELRRFVPTGDFTLGKPVLEFERRFSELIGTGYAIGVGSGTDALKLPLKALGVGHRDEVITTANTFIATVGAINEIGARPVFVDCDDTFCMNVDQVEAAITPRTKAIMPVHFTGYMTDMRKLMPVAEKHGLPVVEDACQGILADIEGRRSGTWGIAGGFSLHPLKNLNVWADGGVIVTNDDGMAEKLRLLRNHGLKNRDEIEILGYNSRLDSVQAIVGNWLIKDTHSITARRIENAAYYDAAFQQMPEVRVPPRPAECKRVFHLYIIFAQERDRLFQYCVDKGIEAKIHYPIPLYQQKGLAHFGYKPGDFPVTDRHAREIISFPCDQHLSRDQQDYVIGTVRAFYKGH
ncbi:MAG: DegT/DnrJ/EryC1/StrS family aminotransferase [Methylobacteriaceae bacterium]|nr:DegT/DnrJ/EryC1/StrS family aminotransferase [Methylobacteriaceae bacterium]